MYCINLILNVHFSKQICVRRGPFKGIQSNIKLSNFVMFF